MEQKPTVYVFHGDDSLAIERALHGMLAKMGDPSIAELNVSRLDGRENSEDAVRNAANSMPFLAERRLVILTHPFARLKPAQARERFTRLFDGLPETTALVLVIEDAVERGDWLPCAAITG
jgi:DNA polymerase-3 subunit delta